MENESFTKFLSECEALSEDTTSRSGETMRVLMPFINLFAANRSSILSIFNYDMSDSCCNDKCEMKGPMFDPVPYGQSDNRTPNYLDKFIYETKAKAKTNINVILDGNNEPVEGDDYNAVYVSGNNFDQKIIRLRLTLDQLDNIRSDIVSELNAHNEYLDNDLRKGDIVKRSFNGMTVLTVNPVGIANFVGDIVFKSQLNFDMLVESLLSHMDNIPVLISFMSNDEPRSFSGTTIDKIVTRALSRNTSLY